MKALSIISRILVGLLFIISGLIKANDPLGFSYKLDEYFVVFGIPWMSSLSLALSIFICIMEVGLGVAVLLGTRIIQVSWLLLLMILFFTWLTGYSAITNSVTDCGCFGDAIKLTPWESFYKDIALLVLILIIFLYRKHIKPVKPLALSTGITVLAILGTSYFTYHCYAHLPVKDFRPYAIGKNLKAQMEIPEGAPKDIFDTKLFYEKDGVVKEFTSDNYPWDDSTWVWKDTKSVLVTAGYKPPIHDFVITDEDGTDHTADIVEEENYLFLSISYDLSKYDLKAVSRLNGLAADAKEKGIPFYGLTSTIATEADIFRHENQIFYDIWFADGTMLKTIIRSNPGLVLLHNGTILMKWHANDIPSFEDIAAKYMTK